jgi:hypothetical protein
MAETVGIQGSTQRAATEGTYLRGSTRSNLGRARRIGITIVVLFAALYSFNDFLNWLKEKPKEEATASGITVTAVPTKKELWALPNECVAVTLPYKHCIAFEGENPNGNAFSAFVRGYNDPPDELMPWAEYLERKKKGTLPWEDFGVACFQSNTGGKERVQYSFYPAPCK